MAISFMRSEIRLIGRTFLSIGSLAVFVFYISGWLFVLLINIIPYRIFSFNEHLGFWAHIPDGLPRFFRGWSLVFGILSGLWWWCSARETVLPSDILHFKQGSCFEHCYCCGVFFGGKRHEFTADTTVGLGGGYTRFYII